MKYVFFDIDGTIRGKSREITKRNKEAIRKLRENGHKAFLCTGRAPVSITQDILDVGFDGVISAAGSFIQIDGKYIYENFLDSKLLQQAIVLFSNAQVGFTLETKDEDVDHAVGLVLNKKIGDHVEIGETLLTVYARNELSQELLNEIYQSYTIVDEFVEKPILIEEIMK